MYLVINKCVTAVKVSNFSDHYLRNRLTLDIGVLGYIGIVQHSDGQSFLGAGQKKKRKNFGGP